MRTHARRTVLADICACALVLAASPAVQGQKRVRYDRELGAFFKDVDAHYPFFEVKGITKDWKARKTRLLAQARACKSDEGFIRLVLDAIRGLRDGHATLVEVRPKLKTSEPEYYPGVVLLRAKGGRVVVAAAVKALEAKLPRGAVVTKVDGKDARAFLDARGAQAWEEGGYFSSPQRATFFEYRLPLRGESGAKHTLTVASGNGKSAKVTVRANLPVKGWMHLYNPPANLETAAKSVYHTKLDDETGYLWLRRMDAGAEDGVRKAIGLHPRATRWVVDLRGNTGGGYDPSFKTLLRKLGDKVAAIIDAGSVSAAETFTRDLVDNCKARIFGARSAGSSSSKRVFAFPSGVASVRYSVRSRSGVGGKPIEFAGIEPDVVLEADPDDVAAGRNTEIEAALEWLRKGAPR